MIANKKIRLPSTSKQPSLDFDFGVRVAKRILRFDSVYLIIRNPPIIHPNKTIMKLLTVAILSMAVASEAFVGQIHLSIVPKSTELSAVSSRRSVLCVTSGFLLGVQAAPKPSLARGTANPAFEDEVNFEPSQQAKGEKIDINNAFVVDYKQLPGMYPAAAGKIASHGPYQSVKDIYNIPGVTANDKAMFKKYQAELTVLPPGRMFKERINQRQST